MSDAHVYKSPFYRVTSRAIILVNQKLVVVKDSNGDWQIPGGGWEHNESFEDCLRREVQEELGVGIKEIRNDIFMYRVKDQRGFMSLRIACPVIPESNEFTPGDDMVAVGFVAKPEFASFVFCPGEGPIHEHINRIWKN